MLVTASKYTPLVSGKASITPRQRQPVRSRSPDDDEHQRAQRHAVLWSSFLPWGSPVPLKRADSCLGYKASNVQRSDSKFTADLTLVGPECNIYGQDLHDLKFLAEWQTGA